ncbi:unnamed protein product [Coregonus sp. 'balchen']|nr:unnamed protein product [Coregonus sp. 'balchen']
MLEYQKGLDRKCMLMGMEIVGITMGVMGWIVSIVACALFTSGLMDFPQYRECTNCTQRNMNMSKVEVIIFGGIFFILAGLIHLILIFLVALDLTPNSDHENFLRSNNLMFSAEFNRWASSLLLIGGTIGYSILMGMDIVEMVEVVGIALGVIGLILTIVICALPTWIEATFIAANFTTTKVYLRGLWMSCVTQSTGQTACNVHNLRGNPSMEYAGAMILTAIILGVLGVTVSMVGAKCTNCIKEQTSQAKLIIISGILFILAGILILIPVSMVARSIISGYSKWIKVKVELGASLYFGWGAAALLLIGGFILCITVGVFGSMMGICGWVVSLVPCFMTILGPHGYGPEHYRHIWMDMLKITCISTILGALGVMGSIFGTKCCNCIKSNRTRVKARFIVGIFFILSGILQLTIVFLMVRLHAPDRWDHTLLQHLEEEEPRLNNDYISLPLMSLSRSCTFLENKEPLRHTEEDKRLSSFTQTHRQTEKPTPTGSKMVSTGLQMLGTALGIIGWIGTIIECVMPMWRVSAFIDSNIITSQTTWEGLWMSCVVQSTGQMQCKIHNSMLALSSDLQAARAMTIIAILSGIIGILLAVAGGKCTNCMEDEASKAKVGVASGVVFIIAGVLCLIPVCWSAHSIIRDFHNPFLLNAQKRELGGALYVGWGAAALLLIGGGLLCCNCPDKDEGSYTARYNKTPRSETRGAASGKDYAILSCLSLSLLPSASIRPYYQGSIRMVSAGLQMLGTALAIVGWLGSIIICALPMWKVTAFIGANIVTAQVIWAGLWMNCVTQSTGQMQCKVYDSLLALPQDLQAARALIIIAIIAGVFAILLGIAGGKCTNFVDNETSKAKVAIASGIVFLIAALLVLVPVCWSANTIIRDFYNPLLVEAQRRELGASLYIGWGSAGLMILGGALLCSSCPPQR